MTTEGKMTRSESIDYSAMDAAVGQNWYLTDPNLSTVMDKYIAKDERDWAEDTLARWGELCGGPIATRAEIIDRK